MWRVHFGIFMLPRIKFFVAIAVGVLLFPTAHRITGNGLLTVFCGLIAWHFLIFIRLWLTHRHRVAMHEAAHVVIAWLDPLLPAIKVVNVGRVEGYMMFVSDEDNDYLVEDNPDVAKSYLVLLFGGIAAEIREYGFPSIGCHGDYSTAEVLLNRKCLGFKVLSHEAMAAALESATSIIQDHDSKVRALAQALEQCGTMNYGEIEAILGARPNTQTSVQGAFLST